MIIKDQFVAAMRRLPPESFIRRYANWGLKWSGSSPAFHIPAALILLAQSVPSSVGFPGITPLRTNMFGLIIGPSSASRKTTAIQAAESILKRAFPDNIMPHPGSPEGLVSDLQNRAQALIFEEMGSMLHNTAAGQLAPLRELLMELYDCTGISRSLVKKPGRDKSRIVSDPRLSILGGVTIDQLEEYTRSVEWRGGFMARFFAIYATIEKRERISFTSEAGREADDLGKLLESYGPNGIDEPVCEGFTSRARDLFEKWIERMQERAEVETPAIQASIYRAEGHARKIATLLSYDYGDARGKPSWVIDEEITSHAIGIAEFHVLSMEEIAENFAPDKDMWYENKVYSVIRDEPLTIGEIFCRACVGAKKGNEALASLMTKGKVERDQGDQFDVRYKRRPKPTNVIQFPGRDKPGVY